VVDRRVVLVLVLICIRTPQLGSGTMSGSAARGGSAMVRTSGSRGSVRLTGWRPSPIGPGGPLTTLTVTVVVDVASGRSSAVRNGAAIVSVIV